MAKHFEFGETSRKLIEIFGLQGFKTGDSWYMSILLPGGKYITSGINRINLLSASRQLHGLISKAKSIRNDSMEKGSELTLVFSSRVAVLLWLEENLTRQELLEAEETDDAIIMRGEEEGVKICVIIKDERTIDFAYAIMQGDQILFSCGIDSPLY